MYCDASDLNLAVIHRTESMRSSRLERSWRYGWNGAVLMAERFGLLSESETDTAQSSTVRVRTSTDVQPSAHARPLMIAAMPNGRSRSVKEQLRFYADHILISPRKASNETRLTTVFKGRTLNQDLHREG